MTDDALTAIDDIAQVARQAVIRIVTLFAKRILGLASLQLYVVVK